jgi:hypothetical protein
MVTMACCKAVSWVVLMAFLSGSLRVGGPCDGGGAHVRLCRFGQQRPKLLFGVSLGQRLNACGILVETARLDDLARRIVDTAERWNGVDEVARDGPDRRPVERQRRRHRVLERRRELAAELDRHEGSEAQVEQPLIRVQGMARSQTEDARDRLPHVVLDDAAAIGRLRRSDQGEHRGGRRDGDVHRACRGVQPREERRAIARPDALPRERGPIDQVRADLRQRLSDEARQGLFALVHIEILQSGHVE